MRRSPRSRCRLRPCRATWLLSILIAAGLAPAARAQHETPSVEEGAEGWDDEESLEDLARRVLELRREAEALLAALPPDLRRRVERRIAELAAAAPGETPSSLREGAPTRPQSTPARLQRAPCAALAAFDRDADGVVSAIDRAWRQLYLWRDDGDGTPEPDEVQSLYEAGVRSLHAAARTYTTASGFVGDLTVGDGIVLDLPSRRRGAGFERCELVVDNDGLRRAGEPTVHAGDGGELAGYQTLRRGQRLVAAGGDAVSLPCGG